MKRILGNGRGFGALVLLGLAVAVARAGVASEVPDPPGSEDTRVLLESEKSWARAAVDGDADRMASYMADDYVELAWEPAAPGAPAHWSTTGKREWVDSVRSKKDVYASVEVRNLTVHLQGALAIVTGEYSQKGTSGGKDISGTGIYANTWARRGGRWLVVHSVFP